MPGVKAYMLSLLTVRRAAMQAEFLSKFPSAWLVWEPGVWQPTTGRTSQEATRITSLDATGSRPVGGDALCFELPRGAPLKVGRATDCDVLINDATVSREHLWLEPVSGSEGWAVRAQPGASNTQVNGQPLALGAVQPLRPGHALRLGDVTLTYLDAPGLAARLDAQIHAVSSRRM
jgi:hypothetical protein